MRLLAIVLLLALSIASHGAQLSGRVVTVADGDEIKIVDDSGQWHLVRLAGIEAPVRSNPFGREAQMELAGLLFPDPVRVDWEIQDRHGFILGTVHAKGRNVGLTLLEAGLAWHLPEGPGQTQQQRLEYAEAEKAARVAKIGLWSDPEPLAPGDWRDRNR